MSQYRSLARIALVLCCLAVAACAPAQSKDFYRGKTVHIMVGFQAGGGYDAFARIVSRHLGKYIPGDPTVVVQNMPGASSMTVTNYVDQVAPQDGTIIAASGLAPLLLPLLDPKLVNLDPRTLSWLPSSGQGLSLLVVWHTAPVNSIEDCRNTVVTLSGAGATSQTTLFAHVMNATLGTKFKLIHGYQGSASELLAMERGEIQGQPGLMWSSLKTMRPEWVADHKVKILLQYGGKPAPDLPNVPYGPDLVKDPKDKQLFDIATSALEVVRPYFMGSKVPADRLALIRTAFLEMFKDPDFLADAKKLQIDIDPAPASDVEALVNKMYSAPPDVVARLRKIYTEPES